jgi:hypothetical protein
MKKMIPSNCDEKILEAIKRDAEAYNAPLNRHIENIFTAHLNKQQYNKPFTPKKEYKDA